MLLSECLHRWGLTLLLGLLLLFIVPESRGAEEAACLNPRRGVLPDRGTVCQAIDSGGLTRTFRLYVPGPDAPRPMALVFVLHGGGGTGIGMVRMTGDGFRGIAERDGAIVVYPDGVERQWNDGRKDFSSRAHSENIDDVGFISRLIDRIAEEHAVDLGRVYATGISNGGMMSFRLGCGLSERLAAIAPVVANMPVDLIGDCAPAAPVSVLVTNGTEDPLIPFGGGHVVSPRRSRGLVTSADDSLAFWARHNGCHAQPDVTILPDRAPGDRTHVERSVWTNCSAGVSVTLNKIVGGGHTWPGVRGGLPGSIVGRVSQDLDGVQEIWAFFKRHRRAS